MVGAEKKHTGANARKPGMDATTEDVQLGERSRRGYGRRTIWAGNIQESELAKVAEVSGIENFRVTWSSELNGFHVFVKLKGKENLYFLTTKRDRKVPRLFKRLHGVISTIKMFVEQEEPYLFELDLMDLTDLKKLK